MPEEFHLLRRAADKSPVTLTSLREDLGRLGLESGDIVLAHASLSALGWVAGGSQTVVLALLDVLGSQGTLMMPTHSGQLTDPSRWQAPPVPQAWWPIIRAESPAFDPDTTPTRSMGAIVETLRHRPGTIRSGHPYGSFAALGTESKQLLNGHAPGCAFGERSPLARLYDLNGKVLLMGVDHRNNTSLHLAEYRASYAGKAYHQEGSPILRNGHREWCVYEELVHDDSDFAVLGEDFRQDTNGEIQATLGWGTGRLMSQRAVVDYAVEWFERNR